MNRECAAVHFSHGPKIGILLEFEALNFARASLFVSEQFECSIKGEAESRQVEVLLSFLERYGKKSPIPVELDLQQLTPFRRKALTFLQKVPFGEVVTYGKLAEQMDEPNAARAVGMACHANPYPLIIPCHRVIAGKGALGGYAFDVLLKERLLEFEKSP